MNTRRRRSYGEARKNMPKIKTHKATAKRFKITKNDKVSQRKAGQDHYNAGQTGNTKRKKRKDIMTSKTITKTIRTLIQK
jgi:large subunit ribosomal protein L35